MNLEEKSILANQVIEPFDLAQLQQNVRVTCERDLRQQVGAIVAAEAASSLYAVHHFLISMNVLFGTP